MAIAPFKYPVPRFIGARNLFTKFFQQFFFNNPAYPFPKISAVYLRIRRIDK